MNNDSNVKTFGFPRKVLSKSKSITLAARQKVLMLIGHFKVEKIHLVNLEYNQCFFSFSSAITEHHKYSKVVTSLGFSSEQLKGQTAGESRMFV